MVVRCFLIASSSFNLANIKSKEDDGNSKLVCNDGIRRELSSWSFLFVTADIVGWGLHSISMSLLGLGWDNLLDCYWRLILWGVSWVRWEECGLLIGEFWELRSCWLLVCVNMALQLYEVILGFWAYSCSSWLTNRRRPVSKRSSSIYILNLHTECIWSADLKATKAKFCWK